MDVAAIQEALSKAAFDGWLFCDFHNRDLMAYKILGLDENSHASRRWFYFIPNEGQPIKLSHKVEAGKLEAVPIRLTLPGGGPAPAGTTEVRFSVETVDGPSHVVDKTSLFHLPPEEQGS